MSHNPKRLDRGPPEDSDSYGDSYANENQPTDQQRAIADEFYSEE